ncbi:HAD family hydrolase [Haladaptatus sp. DFWS20]|uniref:HAD family hydrolase n=1 Tax=Haladaptatus sp. DFWS20 TaxID=3403467 RepID=UPI003EB81266
MADFDAILFDLDSTLCVSDQDEEAVLAEAFDRVSVDQYCTVADIIAAVDDISTPKTPHEFYEFCFAVTARKAGIETHHASDLATAYEACLDHSAVSFRPGAEAALAAASDANLGLVTNWDEATQTVKLDALGISDVFDTPVFANPRDGVPPKPDPTPFERALSELDSEPGNTIHVGDSLGADVAGANGLDIDSVWVPYKEQVTDPTPEPTHILPSLAEFPSLL